MSILRVSPVAALLFGVVGLACTPPEVGRSSKVVVSGSSTVEPITSLVAELFAGQHPNVSVRVDGPGTGDGFQLFCGGETDISDASRPIEEEEIAACEANGVSYIELPVAIDGLTLVANKDLDISCLDFEQIYALFGPESKSDLRAAQRLAEELGSENEPLPDGDVARFTPGPESGTYDSFVELAYEEIMTTRLESGNIPSDRVGTNDDGEPEVTEPLLADGQFPNDNDIVQRVAGSDNGIGFFGFAFFEENKGDVRAIAVRNPDTGACVKPSRRAIQDGSYPIARTLYIYVSVGKAADNKSLRSFVDFYMTKGNLDLTVIEAGYVPLAKPDRTAAIDLWEEMRP